jgi:hypothetical protein
MNLEWQDFRISNNNIMYIKIPKRNNTIDVIFRVEIIKKWILFFVSFLIRKIIKLK